MEAQTERQKEAPKTKKLPSEETYLFRSRFFVVTRMLYGYVAIPMLAALTLSAFVFTSAFYPELLGSQAGGYRADMVLLVCGALLFVTLGMLALVCLPRAFGLLYEEYALCVYRMERTSRQMRADAKRTARKSRGTFFAYLACLALIVSAAVLMRFVVLKALEGFLMRTANAEQILFYAEAALAGVACLVVYRAQVPFRTAFAVTAREGKRGFVAIYRALARYRYTAFDFWLDGCVSMLAFFVLTFGTMLLVSSAISRGNPGGAFMSAFLGILLLPILIARTAAEDMSSYDSADDEPKQTALFIYHYENDPSGQKNPITPKATGDDLFLQENESQQNEERRKPNRMKTRDQIEPKYQWKLNDIYADDAAWEAAFAETQALVAAFGAHAGTLGQSADALLGALKDESALSYRVERIYSYAHLHKDENNGDAKYQGMTDRAMQLYVSAGAASAFLEPEILSIPAETLAEWQKDPAFTVYRVRLARIDRRRAHTLSTDEERLLAMAEEPLSGADNIFTMLSDVDLDFGVVTDENGEEIKLTHGSYGMLLNSPDRRVRREAYEGLYRAYRSVKNTVAATYTTSVKSDVFRARARKFDGALEAALFDNGVPVSVYEQLIEAVHEKLPSLAKYLDIRKRVLGVDTLEMYDLYVPIVADCDDPMSYDEAKALVKDAVAPLGENYAALLDKAYTEGWIDVFETPGKTSGAFSSGLYGVHPFVLLNFQGKLDDAFTLAHELGHAMHSYHSDEAQPYETAEYRIMVAEVASTCNETLMTKHLLKHETDRKKRAFLITNFLESFRTTCFRQTMFAEFEMKAHRMAEAGEPLTVESLSEMYRGLNELYYANAHVDDNIALEWMRIPHFYNAFYVYQYATGLCSAVKLADDILEHGALERYLTFLRSGGSAFPIEELQAAGVDLTKKESILTALDVFSALVDELEDLMQ